MLFINQTKVCYYLARGLQCLSMCMSSRWRRLKRKMSSAAVWRKQGSSSAKTMIVSQRHPRDPMHRCPKRRHQFGSLKLQKESIKGNKRKIKGKSILLKKKKARKQRIYAVCEPRGLVRQTGLEPVRRLTHAPQTCLSAYSSTAAFDFNIISHCFLFVKGEGRVFTIC